ncbi:MAG: glucosaminidase domain-containing protein [Bacteroidales bacterium]|nr:glucosaminidase domain-containing protein [Bacteroidales bacterium]
MKKVVSALIMAFCLVLAASPGPQTPQERYIAKYATIAVNEMYRTGVPASITLAQGIIESRSGQSMLATEGNNHFGIKCHRGWNGRSVRADDDAKNECFRAYDNAEESFRDHSDFLRYRDRYKFLFDLATTDYKGWAYGLKQAGYATDPAYASKLIKCVEDYGLARFDTMTLQESLSDGGAEAQAPQKAEEAAVIPESPLKIEAGETLGSSGIEQYRFSLSRELYSRNGVPFIYSTAGETYGSIARDNHLFLREILRYNDLKADGSPDPGTVVYLDAKKKKASKGLDKYIVGGDDETLHEICQRFAVREKSVRKMNAFPADYQPREGDEILLRPVKKRRLLWKR